MAFSHSSGLPTLIVGLLLIPFRLRLGDIEFQTAPLGWLLVFFGMLGAARESRRGRWQLAVPLTGLGLSLMHAAGLDERLVSFLSTPFVDRPSAWERVPELVVSALPAGLVAAVFALVFRRAYTFQRAAGRDGPARTALGFGAVLVAAPMFVELVQPGRQLALVILTAWLAAGVGGLFVLRAAAPAFPTAPPAQPRQRVVRALAVTLVLLACVVFRADRSFYVQVHPAPRAAALAAVDPHAGRLNRIESLAPTFTGERDEFGQLLLWMARERPDAAVSSMVILRGMHGPEKAELARLWTRQAQLRPRSARVLRNAFAFLRLGGHLDDAEEVVYLLDRTAPVIARSARRELARARAEAGASVRR